MIFGSVPILFLFLFLDSRYYPLINKHMQPRNGHSRKPVLSSREQSACSVRMIICRLKVDVLLFSQKQRGSSPTIRAARQNISAIHNFLPSLNFQIGIIRFRHHFLWRSYLSSMPKISEIMQLACQAAATK